MPHDPRAAFPLPLHGGELILVRHGESTANAAGIGQGRAEYPLSDKGERQAALTATHLVELGDIAAVYTSPQQRAAQTADAIGRALGLTPRLVPDLVEIDIGALSGRSMAELALEHPEAVSAYETAQRDRPHPRNRELLPGWEPIAQVLTRTWKSLAELAADHPGERVVVVAHGGVLNAFLTHLLDGDALEVPWKYPSTNCAITRITLHAAGHAASCVVDDQHLAAEASGRTVFDPPKP